MQDVTIWTRQDKQEVLMDANRLSGCFFPGLES